jgi:hypothetical protein
MGTTPVVALILERLILTSVRVPSDMVARTVMRTVVPCMGEEGMTVGLLSSGVGGGSSSSFVQPTKRSSAATRGRKNPKRSTRTVFILPDPRR